MGLRKRHRQISCQFCRMRKLRCSREFPCSNCTSRGVPCLGQQPQPQRTPPAHRPAAEEAATPLKDTDFLNRLERLEALLAVQNKRPESGHEPSSAQQPTAHPVHTLRFLQPLQPSVQDLTNDALFLELSCLSTGLNESALSDNIVFRMCSIRFITQTSSHVFRNSSVPLCPLSIQPTKCIWLPDREETEALVDKYITHINHIHHIVHGPSLKKLVSEVYDSLKPGSRIHMGCVVLLLSIFAEVTYAWTAYDKETKLFVNFTEANSQAVFWIKAALELADSAQRNAHVSLECVQGLLVLAIAILNHEGISVRSRSIISRAIAMGLELGLNRLDHPQKDANSWKFPTFNRMKAEVGRRVWWHLVGIDWMSARFPGPYQGRYFINPHHMAVRKPLNLNDEDLVEGGDMVNLPLNQPTSMSYFLQRIRLAEIIRAFTDRFPLILSHSDTVGYDVVLEVDAAMDSYLGEVPSFLLMESSKLEELAPLYPQHFPSMIIQRYMFSSFIHSQRCKLHLPYLARGTVEPAYARSREVSLKSARLIIQVDQQLETEHAAFASARLRLAVAMHSILLALIVLLLDLCMLTDPKEKAIRQQETEHVWRILNDAQMQSVPVSRGMEVLKSVIKKHNMPLPMVNGSNQETVTINGQRSTGLPGQDLSENITQSTSPTTFTPQNNGQELKEEQTGINLDSIDWDSLLWTLDAPFI